MSEQNVLGAMIVFGWVIWKLVKLRSEVTNLREAWQAQFQADRLAISRLEQEVEKLKGNEP